MEHYGFTRITKSEGGGEEEEEEVLAEGGLEGSQMPFTGPGLIVLWARTPR